MTCAQLLSTVMHPEPHLTRTVLRSSHLDTPLSAGGIQTSRVAIRDRKTFFFATGKSLFDLRIEGALIDIPDTYCPPEASDYLVATSSRKANIVPIVQHSAHRTEITSVAADKSRLASIDDYGVCVVTFGETEDRHLSSALQPSSLSFGEPGWSGVALSPVETATLATARQYYRDISIYDSDMLTRTIYTLGEPAGISYVGSPTNLGVIEGAALAVYDVRCARGVCVARKSPSPCQLQGIDASDDGSLVAVAGKDRTVHVFDLRTMTFRDRWPSCLKYECAGVRFSRQMIGLAYVCGVDNEVACGAWSARVSEELGPGIESLMMSGANTKSPRRVFGYRGDVRLVGMDCHKDGAGEFVVAMSELATLYVLDVKTR